MRRNNKQLIAVLLAAAMAFTGCAPAASTGDASGTGETASAAAAETLQAQTEETEAGTSEQEAASEEEYADTKDTPVVYDDGTPWLDTSLYVGDPSFMPEESSAADDFYYYVNKLFV